MQCTILTLFVLLLVHGAFCHDDPDKTVYTILIQHLLSISTATLTVYEHSYTFTSDDIFPLYAGNTWCLSSCNGPLPPNKYTNFNIFGTNLQFRLFSMMRNHSGIYFSLEGCNQDVGSNDLLGYTPFLVLGFPINLCLAGDDVLPSYYPFCVGAHSATDFCEISPPPPTEVDYYSTCFSSSDGMSTAEVIYNHGDLGQYTVLTENDTSIFVNGQRCDTQCGGPLLANPVEISSQFLSSVTIRFELTSDSQNIQFSLGKQAFTLICQCTYYVYCLNYDVIAVISVCPITQGISRDDNKCTYSNFNCYGTEFPDSTTVIVTNAESTTESLETSIFSSETEKTTTTRQTQSQSPTSATNSTTTSLNSTSMTALTPTQTRTTSVPITTCNFTTPTLTTSSTSQAATISSPSTSSPHSTATSKLITTTDWCPFCHGNAVPSLQNISDIPVTPENVRTILNLTLVYSDLKQDLNGVDLFYIANILHNCSKIKNLTAEDMHLFMENADGIFGARTDAFEDDLQSVGIGEHATARVLKSMHQASINADHNVRYLKGQILGFASNTLTPSNCNDLTLTDNGQQFVVDSNSDAKGSITLPSNFLCDSGATHAVVTILRNRKAFVGQKYNVIKQSIRPIAQNYLTAADGNKTNPFTPAPAPKPCDSQLYLQDEGSIFSASAIDNSNPDSMRYISASDTAKTTASIRIDTSQYLRPLHGSYKVTWWNTHELSWASDKECTIIRNEKGELIAECEHLTDFTLLVSGIMHDPCLCDEILMAIGYAVTIASIFCLGIMLTASFLNSFRFFRKSPLLRRFSSSTLQRKNNLTILYNTTLFVFYLIFTIFSHESISGKGCQVFAALSYSLLMGCILLTIFQALRTVNLFYSHREFLGIALKFTHSLYVAPILCFGGPIALSIFLYTLTNFFQRQDGFCWVRSDFVVYGIVVPLTILLLNALICSLLVVQRLFCTGFASSTVILSRKHIKQRITAVLMMQLTLGTPWVFQYLAIFSPGTTVWHYLFTIVNGSQGVLIFLLWIYRRWRHRKTTTPVVSQATQGTPIDTRNQLDD